MTPEAGTNQTVFIPKTPFQRAETAINSGEHYHAQAISGQIGHLAKGLDIDAFDPLRGRVKRHGRPKILGIRVGHAGRILNEDYVISPDGIISKFRVLDEDQRLLDFETERPPTNHDLIHDKDKLLGAMKIKIYDTPRRKINAQKRASKARRAEAVRQAAILEEAERSAVVLFNIIDPDWKERAPEGPVVESVPWAWAG